MHAPGVKPVVDQRRVGPSEQIGAADARAASGGHLRTSPIVADSLGDVESRRRRETPIAADIGHSSDRQAARWRQVFRAP